jgi:CRISPR/Cas system-associated protein Cas10 (large subunit of type III CRISPR-Cas system)
MVLDELYILLREQVPHIQGRRRQALILGVLLHDIGKPVRTKSVEIQGIERIASPQHESVGRSYLAFKLSALNLPFKVFGLC